jgi:putative ABC transport system substrate-binding protein
MGSLPVFLILAASCALAQPALPVIGYLGAESPESYSSRVEAFRRGLGELHYIEGKNVRIEYRWAEGRNARLPQLAAELAALRVNVLVATGSAPGSLAAKGATTTIPVVFEMGLDPVALGLVESMSRPGGNVTGVTSMNAQVSSKRLELLREMVPRGPSFALLVNPTNPRNAEASIKDAQAVAKARGFHLHVLHATNEAQLADVFKDLVRRRPAGLVLANDPFFVHRHKEIAAAALRDSIPTVHQSPEFVAAGGLISYGANPADSHRAAGVYAARILKGEKPGALPVQQVAKMELFVNLKTAKAFGLTIPPAVLLRAQQVVE